MQKEWKHPNPDGSVTVRTCAWSPPGCHPVGCGLLLTVKDGKVTHVEGDPEHPITRGSLCPRCLALKDYMYNPDRIIHPMKRDPKYRGQNDKWEQITWDEAFDMIIGKINECKEKYGPESILVMTGTGRESTQFYNLLAFMAIGTPNSCYTQSGWSCYGPRASVMGYLAGGGYPEIDYAPRYPDRYDHPGWEPPKYIMLWGKEPLKSNPDGFWGHAIIDLMQRGSKLICVDPRITWLGTRADMVLQLRPGTDAALALGLLNVIITEDLYDHDFVEKWTYGFDELAERVKEYPPEKVAEITWVPADKIREAARKFAMNKHSALGWGLSVDQNPNGAQIAQSLIALLCITGNFDEPGGCTIGKQDFNIDTLMGIKERAFKAGVLNDEIWSKRIGAEKYPAVTELMNTAHPDEMLDTLESGKPYQMHMGWFFATNFMGATNAAQPNRWYEALKKLDFIVAQDTFITPNASALADVFLPVSTFAEHEGVVDTHYSLNTAFRGAINKAVEVGDCKSDLEIVIEVGKRLYPEVWKEWPTPTDYLVKCGFTPPGMTWEQFQETGVWQPEEHYEKYAKGLQRPDGQPGFLTTTGRIELYALAYERFGDDPLPYYQEPPYSPISTPDVAKTYPFVMTTGARTFVSFHSEHRQIPVLREIHPDPLIDLNPEVAEKFGILEGEWVRVSTPFGSGRWRANITPGIDPRVVHVEHGWWFPEQNGDEPNLFGVWKSNANVLMPHHVIGKMGFGDTFKNMLCKIEKEES